MNEHQFGYRERHPQAIEIYLYSFARLFLMRRIDDMKYIPMISDRKRTTLVVEPLPTLETAKKNFITFAKKPRTDMTTNIPINMRDIYCDKRVTSIPMSKCLKKMVIVMVTGSTEPASLKTTLCKDLSIL
jgi:uncharacterized protein (DUF3084 family)